MDTELRLFDSNWCLEGCSADQQFEIFETTGCLLNITSIFCIRCAIFSASGQMPQYHEQIVNYEIIC